MVWIMDLIIKFLKANTTLTTLSLRDNVFGAKGVKALANTFEKNGDMALRELILGVQWPYAGYQSREQVVIL
jgi:Ran GTPase-activating protein (RanGAP) involved in mRNA processing and transport